MSRIAIVGGTGMLGTVLVSELRARGHEVRALSRSSREHPVDLESGRGLEAALAGADVVVGAANGPPTSRAKRVLVEGTKRLLDASEAHHVCVSIVGIENMPMGYYRVKVAQEQAVRTSGRPWSIVRATQFHELIGGLLRAPAARHVRLRSSALVQPVAAREAARAIADVAEGAPRYDTLEVAGPEVLTLSELSDARGGGVPLALPLPPRLGRALRAGALIPGAPGVRGTTSFAQWLTTG
ncbi:MAG: SDR family oxidoreductase [Solirubrobacteraceae bacterium]